jgi:hypothetical protein
MNGKTLFVVAVFVSLAVGVNRAQAQSPWGDLAARLDRMEATLAGIADEVYGVDAGAQFAELRALLAQLETQVAGLHDDLTEQLSDLRADVLAQIAASCQPQPTL